MRELQKVFMEISMYKWQHIRNDGNAIEITDIQVKHEDTPDIGGVAISDLVEKVKAEQSVEVEMVAGASYSSQGFLEAVKEAVAKVPEK